MHSAYSESDYPDESHEHLKWDFASALMEWRTLHTEEERAVLAGAHMQAGRLSCLKADTMRRLDRAMGLRSAAPLATDGLVIASAVPASETE